MKTDPEKLVQTTVSQLYLAEQIDLLNLSIANLVGTLESSETDLFLEQSHKNATQKKLYLEKMLADVHSPELKIALGAPLQAGETDFFLKANLGIFLTNLEQAVEAIQIVRLSVAVEFKENDVRELVKLLAERLGRPAAFDLKVDKSLIGGAVIQHGNYISDYSLKSRLDQFRQDWKQAAFEK